MRDAVLLRRSAEVAHTLLVVATAYAGALAINAGVALWLEAGIPLDVDAAGTRASSPAAPPPIGLLDYSAIFERNLFGSEPIAVEDSPRPASPLGELKLRGTATMNGRGFAVFQEGEDGKQDVFAVGERVFGAAKLVNVQPGRATLVHKGRKRTIEISEPSDDNGESATGNAKPGQSGGIRKTGENTYLVDRREVEHSIENINTVMTQLRAVPFLRDGKSLGFRVFNIRPGSIFERMGLTNGDVVQKVNGVELNSPSQALSLLDRIESAEEIRIDLLRKDKPNTLRYVVR